ncbi:MAG: serine/threonine-protein kinase, partial [Nannocystaceae bacterium]
MTNELNIDRVDALPQVPEGETLDDPPQPLGPLSEVLAGLREGPPPAEEQEKREVRARLFGSERAGIAVGRYQVGETLGAGGMGEVFSGLDPLLDRPVALKLLHPDPRHDTERSRARMIREAKTLARLSHPNVVQVYEVGESDGRVYIAMELIRGTDLGRWQKEGRHGWRKVLAHYLEAGRGLRAVHEAGLVHRDFKPTNVLLGVDGRVCVADFGLARHATSPASDSGLHADFETTLRSAPDSGPHSRAAARAVGSRSRVPSSGPSVAGSRTSLAGSGSLARLTRTGRVAGTPAYMAPEQLRVAEIDARTDQFGFCVALYEGLYGHRPFRGKTLGALMVAHRAGPESPPRSAAVPRRLWKILRRGLALEPADRFESMDALLQALDPVRARRRLLSIAGVVLAVPGIAAGVAYGGTPDPCPRPSVRSL